MDTHALRNPASRDDLANDAQALADLLQGMTAKLPPAGAAKAPARTAALWVYRDYEGRWCVRQEGGGFESAFAGRDRALACARAAGRATGSYRLFLQLSDGRVIEESFNLD